MRILDYEQIIVKIQNWIKNYVTSAKVNGVIVGMSGGIDSSVTTTLCTKAIGVKNVIGLSLPCSSVLNDLNDAENLANKLGIKFIKIELTSVYNEFIRISSPLFDTIYLP